MKYTHLLLALAAFASLQSARGAPVDHDLAITPHLFSRFPTSTDGTCGPTVGKQCPSGQCCSQWGWCGTTSDYCTNCLSGYGQCGGSPPPPPPPPPSAHDLCGASWQCRNGWTCWACPSFGWNCGPDSQTACGVNWPIGTAENPNGPPPTTRTTTTRPNTSPTPQGHDLCGASWQCGNGWTCWACPAFGWNCGPDSQTACQNSGPIGTAENPNPPPVTTTTKTTTTKRTSPTPPPGRGGSAPGAYIQSCKEPGMYALTFDDGPWTTSQSVLDVLNERGVKATHFVNGQNWGNIYDFQGLLQNMVAGGQQIGLHGWSHCDLTNPSNCPYNREIDQLADAVTSIIGKRPTYFRFPYGNFDSAVQNYVAGEGYRIVGWAIDTLDYDPSHVSNPNLSLQVIKNALNSQSSDSYSAISLSHEVYASTAEYVGAAIDFIWSKGYRLVTVAECDGDPSGGYQ